MRQPKNNSAYSKTERRILLSLGQVVQKRHAISIRVQDLKEETGLSGSSFYIHYKSLDDLIEINENRFLEDLRKTLATLDQENITSEYFYRQVLLVIYRYRDFFSISFFAKSNHLPILFVAEIKTFTIKDWNDYGLEVNDLIFGQFQASLIKELDFWSAEEFAIDELNKHANVIAQINRSTPLFFSSLYKCSK